MEGILVQRGIKMDEIKELDEKYLVLKWSDIEKLAPHRKQDLNGVIEMVCSIRESHGKFPQRYAVLNTSDEANLDYLIHQLVSRSEKLTTPYISVKDLSIDAINSIIVAGNP